MDSLLKQFAQSSQLGANGAYIEDLYEQYLVAPDSVGPKWKTYFDGIKGRDGNDVPHSAVIAAIAEAGRQAARGVVATGGSSARPSTHPHSDVRRNWLTWMSCPPNTAKTRL